MLGEQAERLDVEGEPGRGPRGPRRRGLLGGQRIVGRIHLDQRELAGVIPQPPFRRVRLRRVPARIDQGPVRPRPGLLALLVGPWAWPASCLATRLTVIKDASEPLRHVSVPQESRCQPGRIRVLIPRLLAPTLRGRQLGRCRGVRRGPQIVRLSSPGRFQLPQGSPAGREPAVDSADDGRPLGLRHVLAILGHSKKTGPPMIAARHITLPPARKLRAGQSCLASWCVIRALLALALIGAVVAWVPGPARAGALAQVSGGLPTPLAPGTMTVNRDKVAASGGGISLTFTYTAANDGYGLKAGTVMLTVPDGVDGPQFRSWSARLRPDHGAVRIWLLRSHGGQHDYRG